MKQLIFLLLTLSTFGLLHAQDFTNPLQYFDYLNQQHAELGGKNLEYVQHSVHNENIQEVEGKRIEVLKQLGRAVIRVGVLPSYEGDDAMRLELMKVLKVYLESFEIEFSEINMLKSKSSESFEAMQKYLDAQDAAEKKLAKAADKYLQAQKAFAERHSIKLVEAEGNSEIDQINQVNAYYRVIFMKYFKISKLNAAFSDALNEKDTKAMEKSRLILLSAAKYELKKLQLFPSFKGDAQYRDAATEVVKFYKIMAGDGYKKMTIISAKEELTNEDVDTYNQVITLLNVKSTELINAYNNALNQLLRNNVPKPAIATQRI